jgi:hypothetical protein
MQRKRRLMETSELDEEHQGRMGKKEREKGKKKK